jgi:hypothetical protein
MLDLNYDIIFSTSYALCLFIIISSIISRPYSSHDALNYIYHNRFNLDFRYEIIDIFRPRVGEVVEVISKPWNGMFGYVTRMNDDNSYNIKITKTLNPFDSRFPKNVITRDCSDIVLTT